MVVARVVEVTVADVELDDGTSVVLVVLVVGMVEVTVADVELDDGTSVVLVVLVAGMVEVTLADVELDDGVLVVFVVLVAGMVEVTFDELVLDDTLLVVDVVARVEGGAADVLVSAWQRQLSTSPVPPQPPGQIASPVAVPGSHSSPPPISTTPSPQRLRSA